MSISAAFSNGYTKILAESKNIIDYTSNYQVIYNKMASLVQSESHI